MVSSPDSPVCERDQDSLRRWALAQTIYNLIDSSPSEWALRIGIYGGWGEGKTSVLRFVKTIATSKNVPVVSFDEAWQASSREELWRLFSASIRDRLGLSRSLSFQARRWIGGSGELVRRWAPSALKAGRALAIPAEYAMIGEVVIASTEGLLPGRPRVNKEDVLRQIERVPRNRRLIVLIDDLDRATPDLVPHLLMTVREVLDLPRCAFVIAIDPLVVSEALAAVHPGWGSAPRFLQKIIQFPFWLTPPEREDVLSLARAEVSNAPIEVDLAALEAVGDLLPANPRELKEFFRGLWRLTPTLRRHDATEIKWSVLLLLEIMRAISPQGSWVLMRDAEFRKALAVSTLFPVDSEDRHAKKAVDEPVTLAERVLKEAGIEAGVIQRLVAIVRVARERLPQTLEPNLRYWALLESDPPVFTWREFAFLLEAWRADRSYSKLSSLVLSHAKARELRERNVWADLFTTLVQFRDDVLARAADDASTMKQVDEGLRDAEDALVQLRNTTEDLDGFRGDSPALTLGHFKTLYGHVLRWSHFINLVYQEARKKERTLLLSAAERGKGFAADFLSETGYWNGPSRGYEAPARQLFQEVIAVLEELVAADLMTRFWGEGGIRALWGKDRHLAEKNILFRRSSVFYTPERRAVLLDLAKRAASGGARQENFLEFLRMLTFGFTNILVPLSREDLLPLARDTDLILAMWKAGTAMPLQPRTAGSLMRDRQTLADVAGSDDHLPVPPWWSRAAEVVEGSGASGSARGEEG